MEVYIAIETSFRMILSHENLIDAKFNAINDFLNSFIDSFDYVENNICLVSLSNKPKILCEKISSPQNFKDLNLNLKNLVDQEGIPDFCALANLILRRQSNLTNFELIIITEASFYYQIPERFHLPCLVQFVGITSNESCAPQLIFDFEAISSVCAAEAAIGNAKSKKYQNVDVLDKSLRPLQISIKNNIAIQNTAIKLAARKRTIKTAILQISQNFTIEVYISPGLPRVPFVILDDEMLIKKFIPNEKLFEAYQLNQQIALFHLLGFVKSSNYLLHLPTTSMLHILNLKSLNNSSNCHAFHLLAETLGSENQLAIFQHINGEECIVRALRMEASDPWLLSMQFYASNFLKWTLINELDKNFETLPKSLDSNLISYKENSHRSYWINAHGLQSDVLKISRLIKKTDRIKQFYQEIRRISNYAVSCGYESFALIMANMLEKRCINIPPENKKHFVEVVNLLRKGGFKSISQLQT